MKSFWLPCLIALWLPITAVQQWLRNAGQLDIPALSDPDGNGLNSLLEYAFGYAQAARPVGPLDPSVSEALPGQPSYDFKSIENPTDPRLSVDYYRSREAVQRGLVYIVEFTSDFDVWTASTGGQLLRQGDGGDLIRVVDANPGPLVTSPRFARVRVIQPAP